MKIKWTRPHTAGAMSGIGEDVKIEEIPDTTPVTDAASQTTDIPTPVPTGAVLVTDDATPVHDWQWTHAQPFG